MKKLEICDRRVEQTAAVVAQIENVAARAVRAPVEQRLAHFVGRRRAEVRETDVVDAVLPFSPEPSERE